MKSNIPETQKISPPALAYKYGDALYLNITSKCPTACEFCIKFSWEYQYRGYNLLLKKEPQTQEIVQAAGDPSKYSEIVFCGYGESTYRLDTMREVSKALRDLGAKKIRLNTIGLGSLIHRRDIVPDLAKIVEAVSISLNTIDPKKWVEIMRPLPEFKEIGFEGVCDFIRRSARQIPETYVTAVENIETDLEKFRFFVQNLGAKVRIRSYLDDYQEK